MLSVRATRKVPTNQIGKYRAASVVGPGFEDGEVEKIDVFAAMDDLLARGVFGGDDLGEEAAYLG